MEARGHPQSASVVARGCDLGSGLFATGQFAAGEDVIVFEDATVVPERTYQTVEVALDVHVYSARIALVNHSCEPNLWVDTERLTLVALRRIDAGEMLTFFYPQVEWEMAEPFECRCLSQRCLGWIAGARHLSAEARTRYRFSPHIEALLARSHRLEA